MTYFMVRTINSVMTTETELFEELSPDAALETGVRGATAMLADEIAQGSKASAVQVSVEDADGQHLRRVAVSLSVAPLSLR